MTLTPNYYQILNLPQTGCSLSLDAAKKAYRKALLVHHPDKVPTKTGNPAFTKASDVTVDEIALAYKTLSEPSLKVEYDHWLASNHTGDGSGTESNRIHHTGLETVDLDDLSFNEKTGSWSRACRCEVGGYVVTEDELEANLEDHEIIVGCQGCSLWLRVLFSVEE